MGVLGEGSRWNFLACCRGQFILSSNPLVNTQKARVASCEPLTMPSSRRKAVECRRRQSVPACARALRIALLNSSNAQDLFCNQHTAPCTYHTSLPVIWKTQNRRHKVSYVFLEVEHLSLQVGCVRQSHTVPLKMQIFKRRVHNHV